MPTLSLTVTDAQATRIEHALRTRYDTDPQKTLAQLTQSFILSGLRIFVRNTEEQDALDAAVINVLEL